MTHCKTDSSSRISLSVTDTQHTMPTYINVNVYVFVCVYEYEYDILSVYKPISIFRDSDDESDFGAEMGDMESSSDDDDDEDSLVDEESESEFAEEEDEEEVRGWG